MGASLRPGLPTLAHPQPPLLISTSLFSSLGSSILSRPHSGEVKAPPRAHRVLIGS